MRTVSTDQEFLDLLQQSLQQHQFVKLTLGGYTGMEPGMQAIHARKILVKRQEKLSFTYRYKTRDIVKNYTPEEAIALLHGMMKTDFSTASLFTTQADIKWERGRPALKHSAASQTHVPSAEHDRAKKRLIAPEGKSYLHALGITDAAGKVLPTAQDKFRQINKYIEILSGLVRDLPPGAPLRVVDMGSGKGYLTFALYDYLVQSRGAAEVTGVEYRQDMVDLCNGIARQSRFDGLHFVQGAIAQHDCANADVVIALHACDTATDDAIASAIRSQAKVIVVAPCCHKQIRRQIEQAQVKNDLGFLLRHGTLLERQAEMVTDGMRALMMEYFGYSTKLFEFISDAHTPKNVMIVGTKSKVPAARNPAILGAIRAAKGYFGIGYHHLERVLGME